MGYSFKVLLFLITFLSSWVFMGFSQLDALLASLSKANGGGGGAAGGAGLGGGISSMICAQKLLPCQQYLKPPSSPPDSCCVPLKQMINDDKICLCNIFNNQQVLNNFHVTQDDALKLVAQCGAKVDITQCNDTAATPPTAATASNSTAPPVATSNSTAPISSPATPTTSSNDSSNTGDATKSSNDTATTSSASHIAYFVHIGVAVPFVSFLMSVF